MLSKLPISLAQVKAGNNSEKLKSEIRELLCSLYRSTTYKNVYKSLVDWHYLNIETISLNTENSKKNESNKFIYQFTDKLNLKNPINKNIWLVNLSIYYTCKTLNLYTTTINLKYLLPLGIILLLCLMVLIQSLTFKITLNLSSKNTKL